VTSASTEPIDARPAAARPAREGSGVGRPAAATAGDGGPRLAPDRAGPGEPYGPDDPAYGPPGPGWEARRAQPADAPAEAGAGAGQPSSVARGPFEPLPPADRRITADQELDQDPDPAHEAEPAGAEPAGTAAPRAAGVDEPDVLGLGRPSDPEAGTVGRLRDLYQTAEALSRDRLDRHFDELLGRQRKLISDYLKEWESDTDSAAGTDESATPFGFDTAGSLAGLRGGLRGAR
jgi:hypothetical protein